MKRKYKKAWVEIEPGIYLSTYSVEEVDWPIITREYVDGAFARLEETIDECERDPAPRRNVVCW